MRTNVMIDDRLMTRAMRLSGAQTKRETIHQALELLVRVKQQEKMRSLRGQLHWEGDLEAMRRDDATR